MKKATNIAILFVFAVGSLVAMGAIAGLTDGRSTGVHPAAASGSGPVGSLIVGARSSLSAAHDALVGGSRRNAPYAIDAAIRAAEVGAFAASGASRAAFEAALGEARAAARDLQNGRDGDALAHVSAAVEALGDHALEVDADRRPTHPGVEYGGATLINLSGVVVGELHGLTARDAAGLEATLTVGGMPDFLGLIDVGGTRITVDAGTFLFGEVRTFEPTMVVVPTFETDRAMIVDELARRPGDG